jgi:hypothetical protein
MRQLILLVCFLIATTTHGQTQSSTDVAPFVTVNAPVFVINHVRVVDGTGATAKEDQVVVVANGKIQSIGPVGSLQLPPGAQLLDRPGYTVIPGLIGMHNHLYYTDSYSVQLGAHGELASQGWSSPKCLTLGHGSIWLLESQPCGPRVAWSPIPI